MMTTQQSRVWLVVLMMLAESGVALASPAGVKHRLAPGLYRVDVIVEDVTSGRQQTVRQVERCLQQDAIANHTVFGMFSDTPASACAKYEVCAGEFRTGFIARCAGGSAPTAVGMFALEADAFRGRIEVKNADDQKTNVEIQYGERIGDCNEATSTPPSR